MPLIRHIAGVPTATEQRCVRCCEVIARNDFNSTGPSWPGVTRVAGQITGSVAFEECGSVDLLPKEITPEAARYPISLGPGFYSKHTFWGDPKLPYPCGSCGMSFKDGSHISPENIADVLL